MYNKIIAALFVAGWIIACARFPYVVITTILVLLALMYRFLR